MKILLLAAALCLSACAARLGSARLPRLATDEVRWYQVESIDASGSKHSSILAVQGMEDGSSRWVHSDAFGAPIARLIATPEGWRRDGFVPPNRQAQELFATLFDYVGSAQSTPYTLELGGQTWRILPLEHKAQP